MRWHVNVIPQGSRLFHLATVWLSKGRVPTWNAVVVCGRVHAGSILRSRWLVPWGAGADTLTASRNGVGTCATVDACETAGAYLARIESDFLVSQSVSYIPLTESGVGNSSIK